VCATPDPVPTCGNYQTVTQPAIFKVKCFACHRFDKNTTGPKLHNVMDHLPSEDWFDAFVRNEDSLVNAGNKYAVEIQKWSVIDGNHNFKEITNKQLEEIKKYLNQE
jgi:hypothetical protein